MNVFLVDLTHGGVKISTELAKSEKYEKVFAFDLYNTLKKEDESLLNNYNVNIIKDLESFKNELEKNSIKNFKENKIEKDLVINPIHSPLNIKKLLGEINDLIDSENLKDGEELLNQYEIINHHQATELVLSNWKDETIKQNVKTIEITGVKGKTSTAFILKEIFLENNKNTLLLSSLGAYLFRKNQKKEQKLILQKNISITPANIINTIQLAEKIANPKCSSYPRCDSTKDLEEKIEEDNLIKEYNENPYKNLNYKIAIFENSLGTCGLGNIGILTNLIENYPIAKGQSNAMEAKKQVFNSQLVTIEYKTLNEFYPNEEKEYRNKINSFSLDNKNANLYCESVDYDIDETKIKIIYHNLKTIDKKLIDGSLNIHSFAPGSHHVLNILAATTTALSLGIDEKIIQNALRNFKGIDGRTNIRQVDNLRIIEEINPGINTKAIEKSIDMIKDIDKYYIIIGGKYGVTCEEIDEKKLSKFLKEYITNNSKINLILTDDVGKSLKEKIELLNNKNRKNKEIELLNNKNKEIKLLNNKNKENKEENFKIEFIEDYKEAQNIAIQNNKNILFIYRSNYSQVSKR
ncbi:coenzyme F430 synthase [Methanobrevibacter olleyae]|uniref:Cell wall biosynthesis protein Mur ligase family n=1 Tax=Methanobrevibacter olleyae TaxID=294671 RepID=A0A126R143_METOL|nr:coenzyme F430 synthase [Methanobrevibacter olleyae]AMK15756.1 cell wall biosynthesis protein Mur ligase family [Methanobrevibacter olleyae]